ncbi:MAG: methylmalonyl Co-A mutase-associated GTPase MeaB [Flavobacteriales bacterium]
MAKSTLHISKGVEDAPSINPKLKAKPFARRTPQELARMLAKGDLSALAQGITLVESQAPSDQSDASELLNLLMLKSGNAIRIGVSGVPGVGKSTFLESYGMYLLEKDPMAKVAILAVDPSSAKHQGAILGDKTRMVNLGKHPRAFIRPTAAAGALGGVARATKEAMVLCEAAGFNHIFVETVGVGQSETMVSQLADCFLYLAMPGTGDELQGIKKGIMEMADLIAMNKSEGEYRTAAERGALEVKRALQLVTRNQEEWIPSVSLVSGLFCEGFEALEADFERYFRHAKIKGAFEQKRNQQNQFWFERSISEGIQSLFASDVNWISLKSELKKKVLSKEVSPFEASRQLLHSLKEKL